MTNEKLPKTLYVKIVEAVSRDEEPYPVCSDIVHGLEIEVGDQAIVGIYQLTGTFKATGTIIKSEEKTQ